MRDVMMIQMGARRHYAYPRQLEEAGMLHSLVCDAAWPSARHWQPRLVGWLSPAARPALRRRIVPSIPAERLAGSLLPNLMSPKWPGLPAEQRYALADDLLGHVAQRRWTADVRVVVNYFGNGGFFLEVAKRRGALIVTDFINHPFLRDRLGEEHRRWPGWERSDDLAANTAAYRQRTARLVQISDIYCCPADDVAAALAGFDGFDPRKVKILPYGAPPPDPIDADPRPGRVLCAASSFSLIKGLPYLAMAADRIRQRHPFAEFRVAGFVPEAIRARPELAALTLLGPIGKAQMAAEFAAADMFCLPTLGEGSATVLFESMNYGIPCITTPSSGSVIVNGEDGLIVAERDVDALVAALGDLIEHRDRRNALSAKAKQTAQRFSDRNCGEAFVNLIAGLPRPGALTR